MRMYYYIILHLYVLICNNNVLDEARRKRVSVDQRERVILFLLYI